MQGELSLCDTPPACIYSTRNYLSHLDIPCWYFSIRPSYLPSAMSWTSWSARLSSLALNLPKVLANHTNQSNSETLVAAGCRTVKDNKIDFAGHKIRLFRGYTPSWHTRLNGERAEDACYYGCNDFQNLCDFGPICFYHFCKTDLMFFVRAVVP